MADTNPYEPAAIQPISSAKDQANATQASAATLIVWPLVLACNILLPFLLGSSLLNEHGKIGVLVSVLLFAIVGWALIILLPNQGIRLVLGATILIATQFVPIVQLVSGSIAFNIANKLGQAQIGDGEGLDDRITSEWGGFIVTSVTGSLLACIAFVFGATAIAIWNRFKSDPPTTFTLDS